MSVGLVFKVPGAIFKTALLMALLLTVASGSQALCDDVNQTCEQQWNLRAEVDDGSALAYDSNGDNLAADLGAFSTATVTFDYLNQSSSVVVQRVVTGNDTAKFIKLTADDINNDLLSYTIVSLPSHGNISGTTPSIIYIPDEGYTGNDTINFSVNDQMGNFLNISVEIEVLRLYHPPSVIIRSPRNGEIFTAYEGDNFAEIPIHATSTGVLTAIEIFDGLDSLGSKNCPDYVANCSPFDLISQLDIGPHTLIAKATDSAHKTCTSLLVSIIVNPAEPIVAITNPNDGQIFTAPADITITADVTDSHPVNYVEFL